MKIIKNITIQPCYVCGKTGKGRFITIHRYDYENTKMNKNFGLCDICYEEVKKMIVEE